MKNNQNSDLTGSNFAAIQDLGILKNLQIVVLGSNLCASTQPLRYEAIFNPKTSSLL